MPAEVFRAREADLLRLEKLAEALKAQLAEERALADKLAKKIYSLEAALDSERKAARSLEVALRGDVAKAKRNAGLIGFVLGGIAVGLTK